MLTNIKVIQGNIVDMRVDVIVNAANGALCGGGGVDGAIHKAAGPDLLRECRTLGGCKVGQAKITQGYDLPAKYIIHTVGPVWYGRDRGEVELLRSCYLQSLKLAEQQDALAIAFPAISTGAYKFPQDRASEIAINAVSGAVNGSSSLKEVFFVCYDQKAVNCYNKTLSKIQRVNK